MSRLWRRLIDRLSLPPAEGTLADTRPGFLPAPPPTVPPFPRQAIPARGPHPPTSLAAVPDGDGGQRTRVFDPALRQFGHAFRPGDPTFADPAAAREWADLRRRATDHVLRGIAESRWGDGLVLRGSRLLRAWLGDAAREPGDLDWVAEPRSVVPGDRWVPALFEGLTNAVFTRPAPAGVEFIRDGVTTDDIWTYERAPGRRAVFPWRAAGLPGGGVQVDIVFGEELAEPPIRVQVPAADDGCVTVWAAGPMQSLAWKLLWLDTDGYPQGKDVYDAVLLAERFPLSQDVLRRTMALGGGRPLPATAGEFLGEWNRVDWDNFRVEYPWIGGTPDEWLARLERALGPTFDADGTGRGAVPPAPLHGIPFDPSWRTPTVLSLAAAISADRAFDRLPILADALEEAGCDCPAVLAHCRHNGPHPLRCWIIDAVTGPAPGPAQEGQVHT